MLLLESYQRDTALRRPPGQFDQPLKVVVLPGSSNRKRRRGIDEHEGGVFKNETHRVMASAAEPAPMVFDSPLSMALTWDARVLPGVQPEPFK